MQGVPLKPQILSVELIAQTALFKVESVNLRFNNGAQRQFERLRSLQSHAVMVVPLLAHDLLLVREYAVGIEAYTLTFPKGSLDAGETPLTAANRELMEETGFAAHQLIQLRTLTMDPNYFCSAMTIVLAQDLYPRSCVGDEPEPLELIHWPLQQITQLLEEPTFNEARCVSALFLAQTYLSPSTDKNRLHCRDAPISL